MKSPFASGLCGTARIVSATMVSLVGMSSISLAATPIPITNATFDSGGGTITGQIIAPGPALPAGPQQIGTSGWYGISNASNVVANAAGIRPAIDVDGGASVDVAAIRYLVTGSVAGVLGIEMPEATLWQPLTGYSLVANSTYQFSIDLNAGSLLDLTALGNRGFGIGLTTGSSTSTVGTYYATSQASPGLVSVQLLGGTSQRLTFTVNTGASVPTGTLGVAIFAGRETQNIALGLLTDFTVDNASLTVVPEPSAALLGGSSIALLFFRRTRRCL